MNAIHRALGREVVATFGAAVLVLVLVLLSARVVRLLAAMAGGDLPQGVLAALLGYKLLAALAVLVPAALFIAALAACGRWSRDHEMVILAMAGVGPLRLGALLAVVALPLTALTAVLSVWGAPWAEAQAARVERDAREALRLQFFRPGEFRELGDGAQVFYAREVRPDGELHDVYVQLEADGGVARVLAARARQRIEDRSGDTFLVLQEGTRYDGAPGAEGFRIMRFDEYGVRLERPRPPARPGGLEGRSTRELLRSDAARDRAELQWRLSLPVAAFTLALAALPLGRAAPRTATGGRLVLAVLIFLVYYNLLSTAQSLTASGALPAWLGVWCVHLPVVLGLLAGYGLVPRRMRRLGAAP